MPSRRRWCETPPLSVEARDAGLRHDAARHGEPERRGDRVDVGPGARRPARGRCAARVDAHAAHGRQVDHEAVVDEVAVPATLWPPPRMASGRSCSSGEADGRRDVGGVGAARDRGRALVDHAVPDAAGGVVGDVLRGDELPGQPLGERGEAMGAGEGGHARRVRSDRPATVPASVPRASEPDANIRSHDQRRIALRPPTPRHPGPQPGHHPRHLARARLRGAARRARDPAGHRGQGRRALRGCGGPLGRAARAGDARSRAGRARRRAGVAARAADEHAQRTLLALAERARAPTPARSRA